MKTLWIQETMAYDGTQLNPLVNYLKHGLMGDSLVAWVGPCEISFEHMVDGEDLREQAAIRGSRMLHFVMEVFDRDLFAGVASQRIMASLAKDLLTERASGRFGGETLRRSGDDLYWGTKKLSISIATKSSNSTLMHFAMNVSNAGTPVPTCALKDDFGLDEKEIALELLSLFQREYESIQQATWKVKTL
ncbi:MAG: DUF366 family protein [Bdellovibrionaceae bacterium]|nr:DUF366 family protein [Pseudobdellovibrionaceae bacterium]